MSFFGNLLADIAGDTPTMCGGTCLDSCSGVSQSNPGCEGQCTMSCDGSATQGGEGGSGGACLFCFNSCSGSCSAACATCSYGCSMTSQSK